MVLSNRWFWIKALAHSLCLLPLGLLIYNTLQNNLGADPVAVLTHKTGEWALRFLLVCLAVTPLRKIIGHAWPQKFRRLLGLYAFFYASLHLLVYLFVDLQQYWAQIFDDIIKRPFITVGFAAWLLLIPLAITSTKGWIKRLGKRWATLHKAIYVIAVLGVVHFWWLVKSDIREPLIYASILALLLGYRVYSRVQSRAVVKASTAVE
jgi:methionine sulfoxide reductase heme-binding subunit